MKTLFFVFFLFFSLCFSLSCSQETVKKEMTDEHREAEVRSLFHPAVMKFRQAIANKRMGVVGFFKEELQGEASVSNYLSPLLVNMFLDLQANVIERKDLEHILHELSLTRSDLFDPEKVKPTGLFESIDVAVLGSLQDLSKQKYSINLKLLDVQTGKILMGEQIYLDRKYLPIKYGGI